MKELNAEEVRIETASALETVRPAQVERVLPQWSLAPVVDSLVALRGIDKLAAMGFTGGVGRYQPF